MLRAGLALLLILATPGRPVPKIVSPDETPVAVATIRVITGRAEQLAPGQAWRDVTPGARLATGDKVRTGPGGLMTLDFPWLRMTAGPDTTLGLSSSRLLATALEGGRLEEDAEAGMIKLRTPEALVRGEGRVVVRRTNGLTSVAAVRGTFRVLAGPTIVVLRQGEGTVVRTGESPQDPRPLPEAPHGVFPGADPVYVERGKRVLLSWSPSGPLNHIQVFGIALGDVLIARDVPMPPVEIDLPNPGTYRWRVAARTDQGLEGIPSPEGLICVVDK